MLICTLFRLYILRVAFAATNRNRADASNQNTFGWKVICGGYGVALVFLACHSFQAKCKMKGLW